MKMYYKNGSCILCGGITRIDIKFTQGGTELVEFSLAVHKYKDNPDFVNVKSFDKNIIELMKTMVKGNKVIVFGCFEQRKYTKKDGTDATVLDHIPDIVFPTTMISSFLTGQERIAPISEPPITANTDFEISDFSAEDLPF